MCAPSRIHSPPTTSKSWRGQAERSLRLASAAPSAASHIQIRVSRVKVQWVPREMLRHGRPSIPPPLPSHLARPDGPPVSRRIVQRHSLENDPSSRSTFGGPLAPGSMLAVPCRYSRVLPCPIHPRHPAQLSASPTSRGSANAISHSGGSCCAPSARTGCGCSRQGRSTSCSGTRATTFGSTPSRACCTPTIVRRSTSSLRRFGPALATSASVAGCAASTGRTSSSTGAAVRATAPDWCSRWDGTSPTRPCSTNASGPARRACAPSATAHRSASTRPTVAARSCMRTTACSRSGT